MYDVFIGFPGALRKRAQELRASLGDVGLRAFVDHDDLEPGVSWSAGIDAAMRGATLMVFLMDGEPTTSLYVQDELAVALDRAKREHTRVLVGRAAVDARLPYGLGAVQAIDASGSLESLWYAVLDAAARVEPSEGVRALASLLRRHADPDGLRLFVRGRGHRERFARLLEAWPALSPDTRCWCAARLAALAPDDISEWTAATRAPGEDRAKVEALFGRRQPQPTLAAIEAGLIHLYLDRKLQWALSKDLLGSDLGRHVVLVLAGPASQSLRYFTERLTRNIQQIGPHEVRVVSEEPDQLTTLCDGESWELRIAAALGGGRLDDALAAATRSRPLLLQIGEDPFHGAAQGECALAGLVDFLQRRLVPALASARAKHGVRLYLAIDDPAEGEWHARLQELLRGYVTCGLRPPLLGEALPEVVFPPLTDVQELVVGMGYQPSAAQWAALEMIYAAAKVAQSFHDLCEAIRKLLRSWPRS